MRAFLVYLIKLYQKFLRPYLGSSCRFYPSCSDYAIEAIRTKGLIEGFFGSFFRILRCNPFFSGGYDPVTCSVRIKAPIKNHDFSSGACTRKKG